MGWVGVEPGRRVVIAFLSFPCLYTVAPPSPVLRPVFPGPSDPFGTVDLLSTLFHLAPLRPPVLPRPRD